MHGDERDLTLMNSAALESIVRYNQSFLINVDWSPSTLQASVRPDAL